MNCFCLIFCIICGVYREIDFFVEKLQSTVEFFQSLEAGGSTRASGSDDFVPFV